jgi:hypothetical protein
MQGEHYNGGQLCIGKHGVQDFYRVRMGTSDTQTQLSIATTLKSNRSHDTDSTRYFDSIVDFLARL